MPIRLPASRPSVVLARVLGDDRYDLNTADYNVGLQYLAIAARQHGAAARVVDPLDPEQMAPDALLDPPADVVGFTLHHLNTEPTLELCRQLKAMNPAIKTILGGHHATAAAEALLADHPCVDAVCAGEGEDVMRQLVDQLTSGNGAGSGEGVRGVLRPQRYADLSTLPFPPPRPGQTIARINTSRGCPYDCSFCTTPGIRKLLGEPAYRSRSPAQIAAEMELLVRHGISNVRINDDLYIMNSRRSHDRALRAADELIRRGLPLSYKAEFRVDSFGPHNLAELQKLRRSGLREVFLGVESGSDAILAEYNKKTSVDRSIEMLELFARAGIMVNAGNILASPDSTVETLCDSVEGFRRMGLAYLFFRRVTFRAHVFPGTELERRLDAEGRLERKPRYLTRSYSFRDPRIEAVVDYFEEGMPGFLATSGGDLFEGRKKLLVRRYRGELGEAESARLDRVLAAANRCSADFLLRWFRGLPAAQVNRRRFLREWRGFVSQSESWCLELRSLLGAPEPPEPLPIGAPLAAAAFCSEPGIR